MRRVLLAAADNRWLRKNAPRIGFVRRAVSRFMPGEDAASALDAAAELAPSGIRSIFTYLGENVTDLAEAQAVADHYVQLLDDIAARGLEGQVSVKLTQLGLDIDADRCLALLGRVALPQGAGVVSEGRRVPPGIPVPDARRPRRRHRGGRRRAPRQGRLP
jgi:proline dehydrogenase